MQHSRMTLDPRLLAAAMLAATMACVVSAAEDPGFEKDVLPIFTKYCFNCHGKSSPQLGLDLRSARLTMRGSQNGAVIVPGSPETSLLWKKMSTREMPLAQFKLTPSDAEIETVRKWIEAGARSEVVKLPADVQAQLARFEKDIRPILMKRCVSCHGEDDPEAELDLRSIESLVRGSKSGPVIVEGFSDKSVLIRKVAARTMPPPDSGEALTAAEIRTITRWIDKGRFIDFVDVMPRRKPTTESSASSTVSDADRKFWAFQKPVSVAPPEVKAADRIRTEVDRFVLAKLEDAELSFSPDASKQALLRRAYFDLTGLPPTPAQAREFLNDQRADAYEHLIDQLLASPHYGERWGRYWLDSVGYVDTADKDHNPTTPTLSEGYWKYRDYVVTATNEDMPWDRFLTEQIAGDELVDWRNADEYTPEIRRLLTATGFLRNVLDATNEDISNLPFDRYEALFKLMERVSSSTLGMTLACARCHSHKFDPIPHTDYYRFLSVFTPAYNPSAWLPPKERHLFNVSRSVKAQIDQRKSDLNAAQNKLKSIRDGYRSQLFDEKLAALPEPVRADVKAAVETPAKRRSKEQIELAGKYEKQVTVTDAEIGAALSDTDRESLDQLRAQIKAAETELAARKIEKVQALWDVGKAPTIRLLHRGDVDFAGPVVEPGFLSVLSRPGQTDALASPNAVGETTGLRLAFAEWLTSSDHPLAARVIVNRFWQHHFGKGIVDTPGNFGATGSSPTHPELLDWLAVEFMRDGWSAKRFHKLVMTSTVYRQTSQRHRGDGSVDPENRLLWRMNLRRLDAEALRDSVITVSGQVDLSVGGAPVMLKVTPTGLQTVTSQNRRSIYLLARRSNPATFMQVFDYPVIDVNCTRRSTSATPLQSLTMINSEFLTDSAGHLARRVASLAGDDASLSKKIDTAYGLALSRGASDNEARIAQELIQQLKLLYENSGVASEDALSRSFENFAHMLLCSNEFLYVD
jgi:mono/diheme cytochrome c family protein